MNRHAYIDDQLRVEAWRAMRSDELHSDPKVLAEALFDLDGSAIDPLAELISALSSSEPTDTALDLTVIRQQAADDCINAFVRRVVEAEEKRGAWHDFEVYAHG